MAKSSTGLQFITQMTNTERQTTIHATFIPTANLESPLNMHALGLWEEVGIPTQTHGEHADFIF